MRTTPHSVHPGTDNNHPPSYKAYSLHNFKQIPQIQKLTREEIFAIEVVGHVLPFKTNSYVINELIHWDEVPDDPIYRLTFPQKEMLQPEHFNKMADALRRGVPRKELEKIAHEIRLQLNPHPAGQMELNVPVLNGMKLTGIQHKYRETVLFFPRQGQTCHAYCTFCFRWPQFVGMNEWKFAMKESEYLVEYLKANPTITDVLFTGGDPMVMKPELFATYINALLDANLPNLKTIRIGTKSLSYWPYKFTTDKGSEEILNVFQKVKEAGKHLAFMAHFSHPNELKTPAVQEAIERIRSTGAQIRTQSPILKHINDHPKIWAEMWREQVRLGCIPYYMFVVRDTGAQHYFGVPLVRAWKIFSKAYNQVSGVARTVRGPSMSCTPGKVLINGVCEIYGERYLSLSMIQARNPEWVNRPFFAEYDESAVWLDDLTPAFGENQFFFEDELKRMNHRRRRLVSKATSDASFFIEN
ncbi:MAG: lysine 2,3-aminomutase [Calditrichaeota bacterium]|nr:MAG: lysine 2,3-aminomutase [Calditrichota bacterium]